MSRIERAIISCHDKAGIVDLAKALVNMDVKLIATEGTRRHLKEGGVEAASVSEFTGVREMMHGRVKSLHPKIHAGLLGVRENKTHVEEMQTYECQWIDLVIVNLHPVAELIKRNTITPEEVFEQIDIGGVSMIRSAAKNHRYVTVVVNPDRYSQVIHAMRAHDGAVPFTMRFDLAKEAFDLTSRYDRILADYFAQCQSSTD